MDDVGFLKQQLELEESRAQKLDLQLAEAAEFGRLLLSKNEELQQELEYWKAAGEVEAASFGFDGSAVLTDPSTEILDDANQLDVWAETDGIVHAVNSNKEQHVNRTMTKIGSTVDLAKEYESDLQELIAENRRLSTRAQSLERDNRALKDRIEESVCSERDNASTVASVRSDRRNTIVSQDSRTFDFVDLETKEDLIKSELDAERSQNWELQEELAEAKLATGELNDHLSVILGEYRDQHKVCVAKEVEAQSLTERLAELTKTVQQFRNAAGNRGSVAEMRRYGSSFGGPVDRETLGCQTDYADLLDRPNYDLARQVEALRCQLAQADQSASDEEELRAELSARKEEVERLRQALEDSNWTSGRPVDGAVLAELAARAISSQAVAHHALLEAEELRSEMGALQRRLALAESCEREAKDAAQRQRDLARHARQVAKRESEELRQEIISVEERAFESQAGGSRDGQRDLLTKIDHLKAALQAETKARCYVEAELLRTLAGIRQMDVEMHTC